MVKTDREPANKQANLSGGFNGKRTQQATELSFSSQNNVAAPCNSKQANTVTQSVECYNSQKGFNQGISA